MNPFATWRARLPASIGNWFARDLTRSGLGLAEAGRVTLRAVDDNKIESTVESKGPMNVTIEWSSGTGPQALRSICACGGSGVCEHIVATLEAVRLHGDGLQGESDPSEDDYAWLPQLQVDAPRARARSIWPVISSDGKTLAGTLYLDTPRLRGVMRDAESIAAMMESTPADDWDDSDRQLVRDEAILEAFAARTLGGNQHAGRALARALFRLQRHPRLRFDDAPGANRHPSSLPVFGVDVRGVRLRAVRQDGHFVPMLEDVDGARFSPAKGWLLEGPPTWFGTTHGVYLLDGTFDPKRVIDAAQSNGAVPNGKPSARTIARVAPFLPPEERATLGVLDAERPKIKAVVSWRDGALVARCTLVDEVTSAQVVYSSLGGVAETGGRFIRFGPHVASTLVRPFVEAGFVPRGSDAFALHGPERAATFVRETLPEWDLEYELDPALDALTSDRSSLDFRVSALRSGERPDWFELAIDVFVGEGEPLTQKELQVLLASTGRFAEIRGKLVDVAKLRAREALLTDLADRKRTGFAALLALRDELHESFEGVSLPPEVERLRERLREFSGIEAIDPPGNLGDVLRDYQRRGLDFLAYLAGFGFGGILADDMGVGKSVTLDTRILTPSGWKLMRDIRLGDSVINAQGTASKVIGVYPQGMREAFKVTFSDGSSAVCCDEHLWAVNSAVRKRRRKPYVVVPLKDIRKRLHDAAGNARWYIPLVAPVQFQKRELPLDPYAVGQLLGDAGLTQSTLMFTTADEELLGSLDALLPTGTEIAAATRYDYRFRSAVRHSPNPLVTALKGLKLLGCNALTKFIPEEYKFSSVDDRMRLLQGLMDTDGYCNLHGDYAEFSTSSPTLAQDLRELVQSLGGTARIKTKEAPAYRYKGERRIGSPAYRVAIVLPIEFNPFWLRRKALAYNGWTKYGPSRAIVAVEPVGPREMQCIAVDSPDKLFVIEDYLVTHNTLQTIAYLKWRKERDGQAPTLVIAPTSVTHTWENEIARFAPDLTMMRLQSGPDRAQKIETVNDYDVVETSYALARLDAEVLAKHRFRTLVLDEAQNAKNPSSQIAKVVRALQADHRIALTGTPVENSLRDLWAIFSFLEPGLLGSEGSFRRRFEVPIAEGDERAVTALRSRLEPFVLRRTKEDVARELPERTEVTLECDLSPTQLRMYRGIAEAARRDVLSQIGPNGMEGAAVHVLAALTRLRQVCAHPGLLVDSYVGEPEVSAKFDAFLETIEEILSGNHRVLVFSAFASMLRLMRRHFEKTGLGFGYLDGATKDRDRRDEVERFMRDDGPPVFLCSLKAGGVGLTLTAADYVVLYDPWWNPAIERQAIDRTHRIGQHRAVTAYRLVTRGTVEEKIRALAERKASLSKTVVKTDSAVAKSLTREDLELLFADPEGQT